MSQTVQVFCLNVAESEQSRVVVRDSRLLQRRLFPCSTTRNAGSKDERGSHSTPLCVKGRMALQILFDIKANHVHWEKTTACMSDSTLLHRTASSCWRRGRSGGASTTDGCHQRECRTSALTGLLDGGGYLSGEENEGSFCISQRPNAYYSVFCCVGFDKTRGLSVQRRMPARFHTSAIKDSAITYR